MAALGQVPWSNPQVGLSVCTQRCLAQQATPRGFWQLLVIACHHSEEGSSESRARAHQRGPAWSQPGWSSWALGVLLPPPSTSQLGLSAAMAPSGPRGWAASGCALCFQMGSWSCLHADAGTREWPASLPPVSVGVDSHRVHPGPHGADVGLIPPGGIFEAELLL